MRFEGILKSWNDDRGFGFIEPVQGGQEIFVHINAFQTRSARPQVNEPVSFEVEIGPQGKKRAKNVQHIRARQSKQSSRRQGPAQWGVATLLALPVFLLAYLAMLVVWRPPLWFAGVYAAMSVVTFIAYAVDKTAAIRNTSRTPEATLHLYALLGGWPGALLAQQLFRHKTTKAEFRAAFWATVVINSIGFVVLCSPLGQPLWARQ
jgi:uncharacterized membrane protein YsdA (DUF1294 family)/cold shock CspA family protein